MYQGQYYDFEVDLCYNRYRYYDCNAGSYISQDPIGLAGNNPTLYAFVKNLNAEVDVFGLDCSNNKRYTEDQQALVDLINEQLSINQAITGRKTLTNEQANIVLELGKEVNSTASNSYKVLDHRFDSGNNPPPGHYMNEGQAGHIHIANAGKGLI